MSNSRGGSLNYLPAVLATAAGMAGASAKCNACVLIGIPAGLAVGLLLLIVFRILLNAERKRRAQARFERLFMESLAGAPKSGITLYSESAALTDWGLLPPDSAGCNTTYSEARPSAQAVIDDALTLPEDQLSQTIAALSARVSENPRDGWARAELAVMLKRESRWEEALESATQAITTCVANGHITLATALYREFAKLRASLMLDAKTLEQLGIVLLGENRFLDAAWCLHEAALLTGDPLAAQKRIIAAASDASRARKIEEALDLFHWFIDEYPASHFAEYAKNGIETEKRRLKAA
ncbi:MAG: hypothetical protein ACREUA_09545 [Burkholderiales bacterium]